MKLKIYPAMMIASIVTLMTIGLGWLQIAIWSASTQPQASLPPLSPSKDKTEGKLSSNSATRLRLTVTPSSQATETPTASVPSPNPTQEAKESNIATKATQGAFRVSNRSEHPVRVAMLGRNGDRKSVTKPAHWDFAPGEGSRNGQILSLPTGKLKLKPGDIIVVFAQDGSRRYWGPYVAGETPSPVWNSQKAEWQLVVEP